MLADLDQLRARLALVTTRDDGLLQASLESAQVWVRERVIDTHWPSPDVQEAVLLLASRWFKRRQSPEAVAGWDDLGVVRIASRDPDVAELLSTHLNVSHTMGIG